MLGHHRGSVDVALYIILGDVIRDLCGPAVVISMIIGFLACFGSGLCYAEFASYIPSSGSDYDYVYSTLGEFCGFLDGWSILVASVIATASLAQGAANLLSSLTNSASFDNIDSHIQLPDHVLLASHLNIVAALIVILVTVITAVGVHGSIRFNDCIVIVNLTVVTFAVILGLLHINFDHWSSWDKFAPYGIDGILKSLPYTVFFYGGFVSVTFSSEEVKNQCHVLPRSIVASLVGIFVCFMATGIVLSLVIPYSELPVMSPLPETFGMVSFKQSKYIIAVGGFCSCFSSVLTASYANSRLAYVMARDGLIVKFLKTVNSRTLVPLNAVLTTGTIATFLAAFADLTILVEMCSILAVLPYLVLCLSVITLRYKEEPWTKETETTDDQTSLQSTECQSLPEQTVDQTNKGANEKTGPPCIIPGTDLIGANIKLKIKVALAVLIVSTSGLSLVVRYSFAYHLKTIVFCVLVFVFTLPLLISILVIYRTPRRNLKLPFTIPCFPVVPVACLALCIFLVLQFSMWAWILFGANTLCGLILYFCYGIKHSRILQSPQSTDVELTKVESTEMDTIS